MGAPKLQTTIGNQDYRKICSYLYQSAGIRLGESKQNLVESRLLKRLQALNLSSFAEYIEILEKNSKNETPHLIEAMTTHKTEWFRESIHFDFLKDEIPKLKNRPMYIWSAACSTGEEVWSIALLLKEMQVEPKNFRLLGSDISLDVVEVARKGMYPARGSQAPPFNSLTRDFFNLRRDCDPPKLEVKDEYRTSVKFRNVNLVNFDLPGDLKFDFIFLRNVLIYFDLDSTRKVISKITKHLKPGGYLLLGMSESIGDHAGDTFGESTLQLQSCGQAIYRFR